MRPILLTCCLILVTTANAFSQTESAQDIEPAPAPAVTEATDSSVEEGRAVEAEPAIEEVVVSGEQPGPGLWKVSKGDHVLWILGALQPLPQKMTWRSRSVESVIAESQEVLANTSVDADIGFFKGVMLAPSLIGIKKNPDGATLEEVLPADLYARWATLKARYIGRDSGIEKWRPIFAAQALYSKAIEKSSLTYSDLVWPVVTRIAKKHDIKITTPQITVAIEKPRSVIKDFKKSSLDDVECFAKTLERLETDLDAMRARANAWAIGDVDALSRLPYPDQNAACRSSIMSSQIVQERGFQDVPARMAAAWIDAAEVALANNQTTFAVLSIAEILRPEGYLTKLRGKGYIVEAP